MAQAPKRVAELLGFRLMKYSKKIHLDPEKTTPVGLVRYAEDFLLSSITVERELGPKIGAGQIPAVPSLYLIGHSIELAFKAFLLAHGVTLDRLISDFRHDLQKCFNEAKSLGIENEFCPSEPERGAFELLDVLYSSKQLEYVVTGMKYMPLFPLVQAFAIKLLKVVSSHVGFECRHTVERDGQI